MIIQTILGHKVAAVGAALVLGTTTAAAATGNVPLIQDEDPAVEVEAIVEEEIEEGDSDSDVEDDTGSDEAPAEDATDDDADTAGEEPPAEEEGSEEDEEGSEADDGDADAKEEVLPPENENGEPYNPELCRNAENHGEYVSGVAGDDSIEGNRGEIVSQEARGTCGKGAEQTEAPETDVEADDDAEDEADDKVDDADDDADDGERAERAERGNGNGNNGNGNGRGRGNNKKND